MFRSYMNKSEDKLRERALYIQSQYSYYTNVKQEKHVKTVERIAEKLFISTGTVEKDLRKSY